MELNKEFPNFWSALLVLALLLGLQIFMGVLAYAFGVRFDAGDPEIAAILTILSNGVVFSMLMSYKNLKYKTLFHFSRNSVKSTILLLSVPILLTTGGAVFWVTDITDLLIAYYPMTDHEYQMFSRFFNEGLVSVIMVCMIAPVMEEILFRGFFLRSFLENYSARNAILLSSLLFASYHLNVYQLPVAFLFGCFSGWLYVNTRSLWPSIVAHITYNSLATYFSYSQQTPDDFSQQPVIEFIPMWLIVVSVSLSVFGIMLLARLFSFKQQRSA